MTNNEAELREALIELCDKYFPKGDKGRGQAMVLVAESLPLITEQTRKAVEDQYNKSVEVLKDVMAENFHYRLMCGEIKDPSGKIDVHKAFIDYQELEPERQKFAEYLESRLALNPHHKAEE